MSAPGIISERIQGSSHRGNFMHKDDSCTGAEAEAAAGTPTHAWPVASIVMNGRDENSPPPRSQAEQDRAGTQIQQGVRGQCPYHGAGQCNGHTGCGGRAKQAC